MVKSQLMRQVTEKKGSNTNWKFTVLNIAPVFTYFILPYCRLDLNGSLC